MDRRNFIMGMMAAGALSARPALAIEIFGKSTMNQSTDKGEFPFQLSDEEWRKRLTPEQYKILRSEGTEASCSSPLLGIEGHGTFYCAGCGHKLFSTDSKFDSKTGWPSFYEPIDEFAVGTSTDYKLGYARTEVHCANCGGHLGHIFKDGPPPTGLRYCINGLALEYTREDD